MLRTGPAGAAAALRGRAERPDYERLLGDLRPPALVVAGDRDAYSTKEITDQLVAALPDPEVLILPGVGHLPEPRGAGAPSTTPSGVSPVAPARPEPDARDHASPTRS